MRRLRRSVGHALCLASAAFALAVPPLKKEPQPLPPPNPNAAEPEVLASSALIMDLQSGRILWQRSADVPMYPASTTKILTTLMLLERTKPTDVITAPAEVTQVGESSLHLQPGEQLTAANLALAMMLRSANDACFAVAVHLGGSQEGFAALMNRRAVELGCTHTNFVNPNGLHDPSHVTTAHDLAVIARAAMQRDDFRALCRTESAVLTRSLNQADRLVKSKNHLLGAGIGCIGIKTGYTVPAGKCFVGAATRNGWELITVVMKSPDWQRDTTALIDWAYAHYSLQELVPAGTAVEIAVPGDPRRFKARTVGSFKGVGPIQTTGDKVQLTPKPTLDSAGFLAGQRVGELAVAVGGTFVGTVPLVAAETVMSRRAAATRRPVALVLSLAGLSLAGVVWYGIRTRKLF
ncbi:MAG: D-alanyl-D-alanine carboxypeptidase [Chthonomonas sp.]|nr:D-alanyl-D-alanine carboxypeptidase [Chthonomonas sp.]